jgi:hypothetical protein
MNAPGPAPLPLFRLVIDRGMTTQTLFVRARSAEESFAEALQDLARDGIRGAGVQGMTAVEVEGSSR